MYLSASQNAVSYAARFAMNGCSLHQKRNKVDGRILPRPKGTAQISQYRVAAFAKGITIDRWLRLVLEYLGGSDRCI